MRTGYSIMHEIKKEIEEKKYIRQKSSLSKERQDMKFGSRNSKLASSKKFNTISEDFRKVMSLKSAFTSKRTSVQRISKIKDFKSE